MARNAAILLGVFCLGLAPPLVRNLQLKRELARTETRMELADTRELAALAYLEVTRNNFSMAARHTSALYDRLAALSASGHETVQPIATAALERRDSVVSMLATADPAAKGELEALTERLLSAGTTDTASIRTR